MTNLDELRKEIENVRPGSTIHGELLDLWFQRTKETHMFISVRRHYDMDNEATGAIRDAVVSFTDEYLGYIAERSCDEADDLLNREDEDDGWFLGGFNSSTDFDPNPEEDDDCI